MIVSSLAEEGAEQTVAALALGAADTLPKPGTGRFNGRFSEILLAQAQGARLCRPRAAIAPVSPQAGVASAASRRCRADPIDVLAIGASTGGIHALGVAVPRAAASGSACRSSSPSICRRRSCRSSRASSASVAQREALVAEDGMALLPDRILIAPGDAHLTVEPSTAVAVVRLTHGRSVSGCMPSVDPMFASVGAIYGAGALGVVLTGMGRDGVEGAARLVACGGAVLAQDEASCAVWGMPRAVLEAGLACAVLPPDKIARRIASRTEEQRACR